MNAIAYIFTTFISIILININKVEAQKIYHSFGLTMHSQIGFGYGFGYKFTFNYCINSFHNQYRNDQLKNFKILPATTVSFSVYSNMLGHEVLNENENLSRKERFNMDFTISPLLVFGWGSRQNEIIRFVQLNTESEIPLTNPFRNSINFTTTYLINSKGRNQQTGCFGLKINKFFFDYFNDGAFLIGDNGLGDNFDRYWTGGARIGFAVNSNSSKTAIDTSINIYTNYRVYTGFSKDAYELSKDLLLKYTTSNNPFQYLLNSGELKIGVQLNNTTQIEFGNQSRFNLLGQNKIHFYGTMPYHYGLNHNKLFVGYKYNMNGKSY